MRDYLVFQLYAPLVSWGDQAVGQERPTGDHPSRSALLGLIAAALGFDRNAEESHQVLRNLCKFGTKLYSPGLQLRDFHTAQVPRSIKNNRHLQTRKDELTEDELGPIPAILSYRSYLQDSYSVVALWLESESNPNEINLKNIQAAFHTPHYQLYLGRKSCPLSLSLHPQIISAENLKSALDQYMPDESVAMVTTKKTERRYYWEHSTDNVAGMEPDYVVPRYDQPLSRKRWQFESRDELTCLVQEESNVS